MSQNTDAGKRREAVVEEFEEQGFTIDAKPHNGDVVIKPYAEPGSDEYDELVSFLKPHPAITPRDIDDTSDWQNHIFQYDGEQVDL